MNAYFQDGLLEDNEGELQLIQTEGQRDSQRLGGADHASAHNAAPRHVNQKGASDPANVGNEGIYRTRWLAWSAIAVGWAFGLAAVLLRGGAVEWFLTSVLSMIIVISGIAPAIAAARLTAIRKLTRQETVEGGKIEVQLTLKRSYIVPLVWLALRDETVNESSAANQRISYRTVFAPQLRKEATIHYTLNKLRRGRHPFGPVSVTIGDWLGLTAIHKRLECEAAFVVLPGLPQSELMDAAERVGGYAASKQNSTPAGVSVDHRGEEGRHEIAAAVRAAGIGPDSRPYREGDSLRHLDWRSAAKGRSLQTKVFPLEQPAQTFIAVDTAASAYDRDDRLFDACIGWAAHAVRQAAALGGAVTLLTGQGAAAVKSQAKTIKGSQQESNAPFRMIHSSLNGDLNAGVSDMLHEMAVLRADGKEAMTVSHIDGSNRLMRGGTILVFTADWRGGRSWGELAGYAAERGCRLELFIVTRSSVPSFAMREQQKWLESGGVKVTWLHVPAGMNVLPYAEEGGDVHDYA